jgi:hypothetical protein
VPASWQALIGSGRIRGVPLDPVGTPYVLGAGGTVALSRQSPLFPLPIEPAPRQVSGQEAK